MFLPPWKVWWCYDLSLLFRSIGRVDSARNHLFLISQTQKIGILQVLASDKDLCDQSSKPSALLSLIPSTCYHYFYTLLIPWGLLNILTPYLSVHGPPFPPCLQMSLNTSPLGGNSALDILYILWLVTWMFVFLKSKLASKLLCPSSGQMSLSPLNGEIVTVTPSNCCGRLSVNPPST